MSAPERISRMAMLRVFWRSLQLQAAWNPKGMQNLGFAYALWPAFLELYGGDREKAEAAVRRHLGTFNTHPYLASAIIGGVIHHERKVVAGEEGPEAGLAFKQALMGPLAALGDGFFWLSFRPAVGALAALLAIWTGAWAALFFAVTYNVVHLGLRARYLALGYRLGDGVLEPVGRDHLARRGQELRALAACAAGAFFPALAHDALRLGVAPSAAWAAGGAGLLAMLLLGRRVSVYALLYGAAALGFLWGWYV
ncbi:MAG: PTS system mannose/fructose/sorbose family transporter subunit IID [Deltaproteobacteria bacterium]|nr:PTS system mannose/fructose/sorbose family transporter subunit IID [Deltaproteobacteria bacterium]